MGVNYKYSCQHLAYLRFMQKKDPISVFYHGEPENLRIRKTKAR